MSTIIIKKASKSYKIKDFYYNKNEETYGPFELEDAINFLKLLDCEDKI